MTMELDTGEEDVRGSSKNGSDGGDVGKVMTDSTSNPGPAASPSLSSSAAAAVLPSPAAAATPPTTTTKTQMVDDKRTPLFFQDSSDEDDDDEEAADRARAVSGSAARGSASSGSGGAAGGGKRKRTPPPPPRAPRARRTPQRASSPPSVSAPAPLQASRPTIAASHVEDAARGLQRSVVSNGGAGGDDDSDDSDIVILSPPRPKVKAPGGGGGGVAGPSRIFGDSAGAVEPRSGPSSNRSSSRQSSPAVAAAPRSTQANGVRTVASPAAQASSSPSQRLGGPAGAGAWPTGPDAGFIGSYYCTGWSLAKGRGYCTVGSAIVIEREVSPAERAREKKAKQKAEQEQAAAKMAKEKGKVSTTRFGRSSGAMMAQQKLGFGPASSAAKANGKKGSMTNGASGGDGSSVRKAGTAAAAQSPTIVRFNNARGFEVGRLPTSDGAFLAPLLEAGLVELSGEVIDCPAELGMGVDILLRIDASLTRRAFEPGSFAATNQAGSGPAGAFWQEVETDAERAMRVRKVALGKLFDRLSLRPTRSSALTEANRRATKAEEEAQKAAAAASRGKARAAAREGANGGGSGGRIDEVTLDLLHGTQNATTTTSKPASSVAKSTRRRTAGSGGSGGSGEDDDDDDDAESGDDAEVLDEKQLDELETIYQR